MVPVSRGRTKFCLSHYIKVYTGVEVQIRSTLTPAINKYEGLTVYPWQRAAVPIAVGPRNGLDVSEKRFELRTLQPLHIVAVPTALPGSTCSILSQLRLVPQPPTLLLSMQPENQM